MHTLYGRSLSRLALESAERVNGTANGATIDLGLLGNDFRSALFVITTATVTDGTHAVALQHSVDGSNWTAVPDRRRQGALPSIVADDNDQVFEFGYIVGTEQYVRLVVVTTGATTGGVLSAIAVLGNGSQSPPVRA